ncbi:MAG: MmcQ/YjbR family DNA-binding protein [Nakamurella sp.]
MATWRDVSMIAAGLPEAEEHSAYGMPAWGVRGKHFCWERPLTGRDRRDLGEARARELDGPTLGVRVADQEEKTALLGEAGETPFFTIPHFEGWPGLLVRLELIDVARLREVVTDAWFVVAPVKLAHEHDLELVISGVRPGLPTAIGTAATRALEAAGYRDLQDLVDLPEKSLTALHGVGPKAARILLDAVQRRT